MTTKAPSKQAMEAAVAIMRDVFMWEDDRLREPFGRAAVGQIAAALDAFAKQSVANPEHDCRFRAAVEAVADDRDALRARNVAMLSALKRIATFENLYGHSDEAVIARTALAADAKAGEDLA